MTVPELARPGIFLLLGIVASSVSSSASTGELPHADHDGLDVSHHSGTVDWSAVEDAGYRFAYVKATEGEDFEDPTFADHWRALAESGLDRGAYHFYVSHDDPEAQARFFLETVPYEEDDLVPVVDVESPIGAPAPAELGADLKRFLEILERELGVRPVIYTAPRFWESHVAGDFSDYELWIAEYRVEEPTIPGPWSRYALWQSKGDAEVPGVEKGADLNVLHPRISLEDLRIGRSAMRSER